MTAHLVAPELASGLSLPVGGGLLEIEGSLELRHVERLVRSTPKEDPQGKLRLRVGADIGSAVRFQSGFTAIAGGSPRAARGAGFLDFDDVLQDLSPSAQLEEAYFDIVLSSVDLRIGVQKFAWGKLDGMQPNDVLNPERFDDPVLEDEDDRKVGVPAVAATLFLPDLPGAGRFVPEGLRLTTVWAPIAMPFSFPDIDERWYPPLARIPRQSLQDGLEVDNLTTFRNAPLPERDLNNGAGAGRLAGFFHGLDFALYFYDGNDSSAGFGVDATGFATFEPLKPGCSTFPSAGPECFDVRSEIEIFPRFQRVRLYGADAAYNLFGVTLRAEGAYVKDRLYPKSIREVVTNQEVDTVGFVLNPGEEQSVDVSVDPVMARRDGIEWGFGGDYFFGTTFFLSARNDPDGRPR